MATQIASALVQVNNQSVPVVPNSVGFTEGLGEQAIRAASLGGGQVEQVFSNNIETNFSMVKFQVYATVENIENLKVWKSSRNENVVSVTATTPDGTFTRTFQQASLLTNYEVNLGSDTVIDVEFTANEAI